MAYTLIDEPDPEITLSDDADQVIDIEYDDGSLSGVPLLLTVREDPSWPRKRLVTSGLRTELEEDLADWDVVFTSTTTTSPAAGHAAAVVILRADAALLEPGKLRYVLEVARTDDGNVSPVVAPMWVSVRSAVSRPA